MTSTTGTGSDGAMKAPAGGDDAVLLAGDVGGTNTRLALFQVGATEPLFARSYPSAAHTGVDVITEKFLAEARTAGIAGRGPDRACFGIAGPVEGNVCRATNLPWVVDGRTLSQRLSIPKVRLVNDFHAAALGSVAVPAEKLVAIGGGPRDPGGPVAVLGPGTGLGQAFLLWSATEGRHQVLPSEGGHADFAPRTDLESGLLRFLTAKYGRVSYERVLSGRGLVDAFTYLGDEPAVRTLIHPDTVTALGAEDPAAVISRRALDGSDPVCGAALAMFCGVLGALAGNLALTVLATGGVFVAGGIAPRVLPFLQRSFFREAFERKGRLHSLVARIPLFVVTHAEPGLLGAASVAAAL
jgi:glucokinase